MEDGISSQTSVVVISIGKPSARKHSVGYVVCLSTFVLELQAVRRLLSDTITEGENKLRFFRKLPRSRAHVFGLCTRGPAHN